MKNIYLDNAASTPLDKEVLAVMLPYLEHSFGNPSSIHFHGRETRSAIEKARKTIAQLLNTSPSEIFFTSGGTEADNTAIVATIETKQIKHAITSPLEHHAVLHTLEHLHRVGKIRLSLLEVDKQGNLNLEQLKQLLQANPNSFVSLMHANNEIGNIYPIEQISELCKHYKAIFHTDTVQTIGHYKHDLQMLSVDFLVGSAHKFHGPKGVGFLYINAKNKIQPFIHGGSQERNMRGGTENVYGIVGMAKALELAYHTMQSHRVHIETLKRTFMQKLKENIEDVQFNGKSADLDQSLYTILNVSFPPSDYGDMLLFNLDIEKISASGGSACSSGSEIGSHVLRAIGTPQERASVRFSFSRFNTLDEINYVIKVLTRIFAKEKTPLN
ncbi:MAG: cysteine desulfurase [Microscillaceae bacterium]|nr:cysteine desulfurase [Microscillaceae bacterium]MDW8461961.1 cysteine desulfurase family protein [Cytophagales bacterium]